MTSICGSPPNTITTASAPPRKKEGIYANAKIDTIKGMLPVYDNLERGLAQFGAEDDDPPQEGARDDLQPV